MHEIKMKQIDVIDLCRYLSDFVKFVRTCRPPGIFHLSDVSVVGNVSSTSDLRNSEFARILDQFILISWL
jgi:hypothetical protein